MRNPPKLGKKDLEQLIKQNIPRDAFMALQDAYASGDQKGRESAALYERNHRPSAAGQSKHFFLNETFREALVAHGAEPTALCGTRLVIGRIGIFNIARLNVPGHKWVKIKDSATRKKLAQLNAAIERTYVQGDLFEQERPVSSGSIFILGVMDGLDSNGVSQLTQVMIALPAPDMSSWSYIKPLTEFLALYDLPENVAQPDNAVPTLKAQPKKQTGNDQRN